MGQIERWEWDFGDPSSGADNTSMAREPSHNFQEPGEYLVSLLIQTDRGITDTIRTLVIVEPPPDATFLLTDSCARDTLRLLAPGVSSTSSLRWYLNDVALPDSQPSLSHRLTQRGAFVISLYVADTLGCQAMSRQYIRWPLTPPSPSAVADTVCLGEEATLQGKETPGGYLQWYERHASGDLEPLGQGQTFRTPPLSFSQTYYTRAVDSLSGCTSPLVANLALVHTANGGRITYRIETPERLPTRVAFRAQVPTEPLHYQWDFHHDSGSQSAQPVHTFTDPGDYDVQATLHYPSGCEVTLHNRIHIEAPPSIALPSAFSPNNDGFNDTFSLEYAAVQSLHVRIYDRRGQLVYETQNPHFVWDGIGLTGQLVREGIYVCLIEGRDQSGSPIEKKETLTVIR
jgi:gliding motility-associated-like protein